MDGLPLVLHLAILAAAVVLHEVGHGVVAYGCGDATAAEQGRLTLNPLRHVDPLGTVVVPGLLLASAWATGTSPLLFGWAKPVPVNPSRLRRPRRDMALVAIAGPAVNLALAGLAALVLGATLDVEGFGAALVRLAALAAIGTNCVLAVLNLLPILPLDGGRILAALLPPPVARAYGRMEAIGLLLVVVLLSQTQVLSVLVRPVLRAFLALGTGGVAGLG
jgi:Zn-dependent protease